MSKGLIVFSFIIIINIITFHIVVVFPIFVFLMDIIIPLLKIIPPSTIPNLRIIVIGEPFAEPLLNFFRYFEVPEFAQNLFTTAQNNYPYIFNQQQG